MHWLQEKFEVIPVCPRGFKHIGRGCLAREQQHFAVRATLSHLNREFDSRQLRHYDIGNQQVRGIKPRGIQSIEGIGEGSRMEAALKAQNHCQSRCDDIFIIDNKDTRLLPEL